MRTRRLFFRTRSLIGRFARADGGATAIEYGLIVSLIFVAITAAVRGYTDETKNMYSEIQSSLETAGN